MDYTYRHRRCKSKTHSENEQTEESVSGTALAGITNGQMVQELGYDDDCDEALRAAVVAASGAALLDDDTDEVVDAVLLWFREEDGDLVDALVDAITPLADHGVVWLLTPKAGRAGNLEPADIAEAAPTAGLQQTSTINAANDWQGTRLVSPRAARSK